MFSGSRKIPTLGSTVRWETRQASFPTGTVGPQVGIFLSPLNTNDGFYLSRISYAYLTWVAMWDRFFRQQAYIGITQFRMRWYASKKNPSLVITVCHHSASLVMPIGDPRDGFFYPTLTLMMDTYILSWCCVSVAANGIQIISISLQVFAKFEHHCPFWLHLQY